MGFFLQILWNNLQDFNKLVESFNNFTNFHGINTKLSKVSDVTNMKHFHSILITIESPNFFQVVKKICYTTNWSQARFVLNFTRSIRERKVDVRHISTVYVKGGRVCVYWFFLHEICVWSHEVTKTTPKHPWWKSLLRPWI